ncbi:MAG: ABC transporter ATP-binding protein [Burkholderiales bacterium]|nr:ABC transporter ATP-binding protein [Burkholderiales bacterium]
MSPPGPADSPEPSLPAVASGVRLRWLGALITNGLLRSVLAVGVAVAMRHGFDRYVAPGSGAGPGVVALLQVLAAIAAVVGFTAWLKYRETVDSEALAQHYIAQVRLDLFDRLARMSQQEMARRSRGGVLLRFIGDVQALRAWVGLGIARMLVAVASGLVLMAGLAWLAPALAVSVALLVTVVAVGVWVGLPGMRTSTRASRRRHSQVAANMQDKVAALQVVQAAQQGARERRRVDRQNQRLSQALQHRATMRGRHRAWVALGTGGGALAVAAHALWPLVTGNPPWSAGTVVAGAAIVGLLAAPLRDLGRGVEAWVAASVARERLLDFLRGAAPSPVLLRADAARTCTLQFDGAVLARRVGPIDAVVPHGRRVAVCGPPGSGKSSLLWLASGLVPPTAGLLLLDDTELAALDPVNLRKHIGLVAPELGLLRGTVGSNLRYHGARSSADALQLACDMAGLTPMLERMPDGLRTRVRDGGLNLSQGERRALQLARVLAGRPSVLLIDDVHACLPGDAESRLAELLSSFEGTVMYSTTDASLALLADEIWTLDTGRRVAALTVPKRATEPTVVSPQLH